MSGMDLYYLKNSRVSRVLAREFCDAGDRLVTGRINGAFAGRKNGKVWGVGRN